VQNLAVMAVSVSLSFGIMEWGTSLATSESRTTRWETIAEGGPYYREDRDLGYAPRPGIRVQARKYHKADVVYDVVYRIDGHGLRQIPNAIQGTGCPVLFFGGSLTFGEGVDDEQTMPSTFLKASHRQFQVYNFGFHGYGPHQMLRALEVGRVEQIVHDRPTVVVYQGIEGHVARAAGKVQWDLFGPRYQISGDTVEFTGPFHGTAYRAMHETLKWSVLFRFLETRLIERPPDSHDIATYVHILERVRNIVEEKYGARFVIVFWDKGAGVQLSAQVFAELRDRGFEVLPVSAILQDVEARRIAYVLSEYDPHPNAHAHALLGEYLARRLTGTCGAS
jgi:hypothetical protein